MSRLELVVLSTVEDQDSDWSVVSSTVESRAAQPRGRGSTIRCAEW